MRIAAVVAVVCSLFGGIWLELTRPSPRPAPVVGARVRTAPAADAPVAALDCETSAGRAHAGQYALPHLGGAALLAMDRVLVRPVGSFVTLAGWRMDISSDRGAGGITSVELAQGTCYVGDGILAEWPKEDLARAYVQLTPDPPPEDVDFTQLD